MLKIKSTIILSAMAGLLVAQLNAFGAYNNKNVQDKVSTTIKIYQPETINDCAELKCIPPIDDTCAFIEIHHDHPTKVLDLSNEEYELMARVVMSEGSILSLEGKQAIAEVIINRVLSDNYPNTVADVIYQKNQFSLADNGTPNSECYTAIDNALECRSFPTSMMYFRDSKPHSFGYYYCKIGNMYFNTTEDVLNQKGEEQK